jgi:hypothetical protein
MDSTDVTRALSHVNLTQVSQDMADYHRDQVEDFCHDQGVCEMLGVNYRRMNKSDINRLKLYAYAMVELISRRKIMPELVFYET